MKLTEKIIILDELVNNLLSKLNISLDLTKIINVHDVLYMIFCDLHKLFIITSLKQRF